MSLFAAGRGLRLQGRRVHSAFVRQDYRYQPKRYRSAVACCESRPGRGALIVFEGIDRCGKSTQCNMLCESLRQRGMKVEQWSFPDRTTSIGRSINEYLQNKASRDDAVIHLLFTANRFEKRSQMLQLLASGTTLVVDRYSYSGVAYTAAKGLPHLGASYCRAVETGLPAADLVVLMELSEEESGARGGYGHERYETLDFQRRVIQQYESLKDPSWLTVDARAPPEQIHDQVLAKALPVVDRAAAGAPLGQLWDHQPMELPQSSELQAKQLQQPVVK